MVTEIDTSYVLDGGALLHRVRWLAGNNYKEVTMQYMSYVRHRYGTCSIVFDGYSSLPSLKDHEHKRRAGKASADIQISPEMNAPEISNSLSRTKRTRYSSLTYSATIFGWMVKQ